MITAKTIIEFNAQLNEYKYGCIQGTFPDDYRSIEPSLFDRVKKGVCWDFVAFQAYYFTKMFPLIKYKFYYLEAKDGELCHSFMIFRSGLDEYCIFESCKHPKGIRRFKHVNDALDYEVKLLVDRSGWGYAPYIIYEYELPKEYNLDCCDYMKHVYHTGKMLRNNRDYYDIIRGV